MLAVAAHTRWRAASSAPGFGRQRFDARRPDGQRRLHANHIGQTAGCYGGAERAVDPITGIGQHDARSDARCEGGSDLSEGDLRFGPECHVVRDTSLFAPGFVHSPIFRQIKPIGDRQARRMIGDRKRHRDLTIVGLAEPPAILPGDAHRMNAFLREARVVDNPGLDLPLRLDRWQDQFARLGQNRLVRPSRLTDQMQKRLMLGRNPSRRNNRRHWLDALAFAGHQQASAIILERPRTILAAQNCRQGFNISEKRLSLDCVQSSIFPAIRRPAELRRLPNPKAQRICGNVTESETKGGVTSRHACHAYLSGTNRDACHAMSRPVTLKRKRTSLSRAAQSRFLAEPKRRWRRR